MPHKTLLSIFCCLMLTANAQIEFSWATGIGSTLNDFANSVTEDNTGAIITGGYFQEFMDFDPGPENAYIDPVTTSAYVTKVDASGNFIWAKGFISSDGTCVVNAVATDADNNIYAIGYFNATVDFNPNAGVLNLTTSGLQDIFIVKLTENGGLIWAKQLGGPENDDAFDLTLDTEGNIYMTGGFQGTIDLEIGPGETNFTSFGSTDIFITKLDNDGNSIWVKQIGGVSEDVLYSIVVAESGNIYVSGFITNAADFDPDAGEAIIADLLGPVVAKYTNDGAYVWAKSYGSTGFSFDVAIDADENVINVGYSQGGIDLDPGPGIILAYVPGFYGSIYYISKLNSDGEYLWGETFGGPNETNTAQAVTIDNENNIYITGNCAGTFDADPGPGVFNIYGSSLADIFMHKLDPNGNFIHAFKIGGINSEVGYDIQITSNGSILIVGTFEGSTDFNPGAETFYPNYNLNRDIFSTVFTQDVCANLAIVVDTIVSIDCLNFEGLGAVHGTNTYAPYNYSWNTIPATENDTVIFPGGGWYEVTVTDNVGCAKKSTLLVSGPTELSELNLDINLSAGLFRPGTPVLINIDAYNAGCLQASGECKVVLPQIVTYNTADPLPDMISGDTLIWNFSNITYESEHITPVITATTLIGIPIGTPVLIHTEIGPNDGDTDTINNVKDYSFEVQNSFDPNDKQVYPQGTCDKGYILNNQQMTYTVRFQNTGTLEALNIYILDTISTFLDINSLQVVGASHNYVTELMPDNVVKFIFNDIFLPDSTTNEPESHGYITYTINQNPDLPNNSKIKNTAAIYFDFNDPVITNTVLNTITNEINTYESTNMVSICEGDSIIVGYHVYKVPGSYVDVLSTDTGCDSTVTTILNFNSPIYNTVFATICHDESYMFNGLPYFEAGVYDATFIAANGCDSIVQLNLEINPEISLFTTAEICPDETILFNGDNLNIPGTYIAVLTAANGCDSTVYLELTHKATTGSSILASICDDETYLFNGTEITDAGSYESILTGINGCDSIVNLTLIVNPTYTNVTDTEICIGDSILFNGNYYSTTGTYSAVFTNILGCDSSYTLNLATTTLNTEILPTDTILIAAQDDAIYQWVDCYHEHNPISGATSQDFQPEEFGYYAVIINVNGCIDTSECFHAGPVDITSNLLHDIVIYPNPANDILNITIQKIESEAKLLIFDMLGQLVFLENNSVQTTNKIDISGWQSGCYVLQYTTLNTSQTITFTKE